MSDRRDANSPSEHASDWLVGRWLDAPDDGDWAAGAAREIDPLRAADLALLDGLLEYVHHRDATATEERIARVLAAIDAQPLPMAHLEKSRRTAGSTVARKRRWAVAAITIAATVAAGLFEFYSSNDSARTAHAAVRQAYRDASALKDRQYAVHSQVRTLTGRVAAFESRLYVRGGERFALAHPGFLGDLWVGGNGRQYWLAPAIGGIKLSDRIQEPLDWATDHGVAMPDLQLTELLSWLEQEYELNLVGEEPASNRADGAVLRHVRGVYRGSPTKRPRIVDLWADATTGVAQRIVLDWQRADDDPGLATVTLELVAESPLDDAWYEPESHLSGRPILPQSPLLLPHAR